MWIFSSLYMAYKHCYFCAAFLFYEPEKVPARFHDLNADHQRMLDSLKASGLNWVAVLPPHLTGDNIFNILFQHPMASYASLYTQPSLIQLYLQLLLNMK
jgi:hypothetical protein